MRFLVLPLIPMMTLPDGYMMTPRWPPQIPPSIPPSPLPPLWPWTPKGALCGLRRATLSWLWRMEGGWLDQPIYTPPLAAGIGSGVDMSSENDPQDICWDRVISLGASKAVDPGAGGISAGLQGKSTWRPSGRMEKLGPWKLLRWWILPTGSPLRSPHFRAIQCNYPSR